MKSLFLLLLLSFSAFADEPISFNHQDFILSKGFCMAVFIGEKQFGWCITKFSSVAEQKIAQLLAEKLAFQNCNDVTINCELFKSVCAN